MNARVLAVSKWIPASTALFVVATTLGCASPPATPPSSSPVYAEPDSSIPLTPVLHRSSLRRDERVVTAPTEAAPAETPSPAPAVTSPGPEAVETNSASPSDASK